MIKRKYLKIILYSLLILFGMFLFVYGEYDDSPGAQLIGVIVAIVGIVSIIKIQRKNALLKSL